MTDFEQAGVRYRSMSAKEKEALEINIAGELLFEKKQIREQVLVIFKKTDEILEKKLRKRLYF